MTTVEVFFPENSGDTTVDSYNEAVVKGQDVLWNIKSENPEVTKVQILFDNGEKFFPGREPEKTQMQVFPKYHGGVSYHMIWGKAPDEVPNGELGKDRCVTCKYTILGLNDNDKNVVEPFDPNIIISDPGL